ncbi:Alpha/Beta hydrolase protein [Leucosporidium creatinivorum]|uniref:Alpha/Beta hydrolase protein n=1 Tax=Leucosporidium creatinivorum TaxID=106004 RepID=A0A1Y2G1Q8_9BASI|nr:Alpha/Beta hydrolase protein [Leucosporidium creatinivorum]
MDVHLNIPYTNDPTSPRQALDLFLPHGSSSASPLLVFIHGGAWRSESKEDFTQTLMPSLVRSTSLPLACLEYRLAPTSPHPAQALDSLSGLSLLTSPSLLPLENGSPRWDRNSIYLIGHSAGAFIALSLVLRPPKGSRLDGAVEREVRRAVKGVVCVDGIYDLPSLLEEYPAYDSFVNDAFGLEPSYLAQESPARWELVDEEGEGERELKILVLHSKEDELLSLRQPEMFVERFMARLEGKAGRGSVEVDFESLKDGHAQLLEREELPLAVGEWDINGVNVM